MNMKYKAIIIDDDQNGIQAIINLINQFELPAEIVGTAQTIAEGIPLLNKEEPDLLFLDIEMKNESGFELLEIWEPKDIKVIFCTGYEEYAIKALKKGAFDYILKPLDYKEFIALFAKLEENRSIQVSQTGQSSPLNEENNSKITIKSPGGIFIIETNEINYFLAEGRYTIINHGDDQEITSSKNLGHYESLIKDDKFIRSAKSMIINKDRLKGVEKRGSKSYIHFNGCELEISDGIRKSIMKLLE